MGDRSENPDERLGNERNNEIHRSDDSLNDVNQENSSENSSPRELTPDINPDVRNWNSGSGFPKGDRRRVLGETSKESSPDDEDGIFDDDEDEVL